MRFNISKEVMNDEVWNWICVNVKNINSI
jgi:hypothetical protein